MICSLLTTISSFKASVQAVYWRQWCIIRIQCLWLNKKILLSHSPCHGLCLVYHSIHNPTSHCVGTFFMCVDWPASSWWLQMAWRRIETRPSATLMLTWLWQYNFTRFILRNIHIALQLLHRLFGRSRQIRWFLDCCCIPLNNENGLAKRPTSQWQPHGYLTMGMSPDGRYWYHYSGTLSFTPLPRVWKWHLQTPDLVAICRPMWLEQCGGVPNWLAEQWPPRSKLYRAAPFTNGG